MSRQILSRTEPGRESPERSTVPPVAGGMRAWVATWATIGAYAQMVGPPELGCSLSSIKDAQNLRKNRSPNAATLVRPKWTLLVGACVVNAVPWLTIAY